MKRTPLSGVRDVVAAPPPTVALDDTDVALLRLLIDDARMSQRQLAAKLGVSPPTVAERMSRLERSGVVRGYSAQIDWDVLGVSQIVYLTVSAGVDSDIAQVMVDLWKLPEIEAVTLITGEQDLLVRLRVRDYTHLKRLLMESIWSVEGLQGTTTQLAVGEMPPKEFDAALLQLVVGSRDNDAPATSSKRTS